MPRLATHRPLMFELRPEKRRLTCKEVVARLRLLVPLAPHSLSSLRLVLLLLLTMSNVKEEKRSRLLRALPILNLLRETKILLMLLPGVRCLFRSPRLQRSNSGLQRCRLAGLSLVRRCLHTRQWRWRAV